MGTVLPHRTGNAHDDAVRLLKCTCSWSEDGTHGYSPDCLNRMADVMVAAPAGANIAVWHVTHVLNEGATKPCDCRHPACVAYASAFRAWSSAKHAAERRYYAARGHDALSAHRLASTYTIEAGRLKLLAHRRELAANLGTVVPEDA